jgi:hypothetical protein
MLLLKEGEGAEMLVAMMLETDLVISDDEKE